MKKGWIIGIIVVAFLGLLGSCGDDGPSYSSEYYSNDSYREDVGEIADAFGMSDEEVDRKINAIVDEMN